jgi:molecular chaperone HscB
MFRPFLHQVSKDFSIALVTRRPSSLLVPSSRYYARAFSDRAGSHSVVTSLTKMCPSCGAVLPTALPVCPNCNYIARIHDSISYHDLLGLTYEPNPFIVDRAILKRRFLEAQRISHPDAWATKGEVSHLTACIVKRG